MNNKCADMHLETIATFLPKWKAVARQLGLESRMIADIKGQCRNPMEQSLEALTQWMKKEGSQATYKKIYDALCDLDEKEAAEKVVELTKGQIWFL